MAAPKGNRFWELRSSAGNNPIFEDSEHLWACACEYFEWVEAHPLIEYKAMIVDKEIDEAEVPKPRAMSLCALCVFLDIAQNTYRNYREREGFLKVTQAIDGIMYSQKFEGASAGLFNANIIARDLGLADVSKNEHTGKDGGPIETKQVREMTDDELLKIVADDKS